MKRASPGKAAYHHQVGVYSRPTVIIKPHSGAGGCAPIPRKPNAGIVMNMSVTLMIRLSIHPPEYPEVRPRGTPITFPSATDRAPTTAEMRKPIITLEKMSRPASSVPKKYFELGGSNLCSKSVNAP